jgi:hypothetical protein
MQRSHRAGASAAAGCSDHVCVRSNCTACYLDVATRHRHIKMYKCAYWQGARIAPVSPLSTRYDGLNAGREIILPRNKVQLENKIRQGRRWWRSCSLSERPGRRKQLGDAAGRGAGEPR